MNSSSVIAALQPKNLNFTDNKNDLKKMALKK